MDSRNFVIDRSVPDDAERARGDLGAGLAAWRLAFALAKIDLRNRYRGSVIGPFWVTLSTAIMSVALGALYGSLFKQPLSTYIPYLTTSLVLWTFLAAFLNDMVGAVSQSGDILRQIRMPVSVLFLRCVFRNLFTFAHSLPLIPIALVAFGQNPGWAAAAAVPAFALLLVAGFWLTMFLGVICMRFRDVGPIVANVTQLALFVTPVIWRADMLNGPKALMLLNPFYVMIEIVRAPLLGAGAGFDVWLAAFGYTALAVAAGWLVFVRFRSRLAFWI